MTNYINAGVIGLTATSGTERAMRSFKNSLGSGCAILALLLAVPTHAEMGRTASSWGVSPSGAATYSIPIWVQPGPKGLHPSLAFSYDSQAGNGTMGVGWALSGFSSIDRCPWTAAEDGEERAVSVTASDRFCMSGNKLRITSGTLANYGTSGAVYQTELADFSRITSVGTAGTGPESFLVHTKDGLILEFGSTADSRVILSGTTVFRWLLSKVSDRDGNSYVVSYTTDNATGRVPLAVSWGNTTAGGGTYQYQAAFGYSNKMNPRDVISARQGNDTIVTRQRLDSVAIGYSASGSSYSTKRQYILEYQLSPTTGLSRLTQVKECAATTSNCLNPTNIVYQNGAAGVSNSSTTAILSAGAIAAKYDFDGDGRTDIAYLNGGTYKVVFSTGAGFSAPLDTGVSGTPLIGRFLASHVDGFLINSGGTWTYVGYNGSSFTSTSTGTSVTSGAILTDYNGDGLQDFVWTSTTNEPGGWVGRVHLRLNTTTGAASVPTFDSTVYAPFAMGLGTFGGNITIVPYTTCPTERQCDINGDGAADMTVVVTTTHTCTGGPGGCTPVTTGYDLVTGGFSFGYYVTNGTPGVTPYLGIRFNDDRCIDSIKFGTSEMKVYGCGTGAATVVPIPAVPIAVLDWDGDGRTDLLTNNGGVIGVYVSNGTISSPFSSLITTSIPYNSGCNYFPADVEGDGLDELACVTGSGLIYYSHNGNGSVGSGSGTSVFATQVPDVASSITDGYGVAVNPFYVSTAQSNYTKGDGTTLPLVDATDPIIVVGRLRVSDGIGTTYDLDYSYKGARRHGKLGNNSIPSAAGIGPPQLQLLYGPDGRSAGFEEITAADSRNGRRQRTTYEQLFPLTGMVKKAESIQPDSTPIIVTTFTNLQELLDSTTNNQRYFPYVSQVTSDSFEVGGALNGQLITSTLRTFGYAPATYGNLSTLTTVVTDKDSTSTPSAANQSWTTTVSNSYAPADTANWCVGLPSQIQITQSSTVAGASTVTRTTGLTADGANPSKCRIKVKTVEPDSPKYRVTETYEFDSFGNTSAVDVVGREPAPGGGYADMPVRRTTISYGATGQFPSVITDAVGGVSVVTPKLDLGTVWKIADQNSTASNVLETIYDYDAFARRTKETRADGTYTTWSYDDCVTSGCSGLLHRMSLVETSYDKLGNAQNDRHTYLDAFERPFIVRSRLLNGAVWNGTYQWVEAEYDAFGRVFREYMPCSTISATTTCRLHATTSTYDLLGRLTQTSRPRSAADTTAQTTTFSYAGRTQTIVDALGKTSTKLTNVDGTTRQIRDANNYAINFAYDAAGSVSTIVDSLSNVKLSGVTTEYGRSAFQVAANDTALGASTKIFNSLGDLIGWTDAKSQPFSATYDKLSRPLSRTEPDNLTTWTWGDNSANFNIGRLQSISSVAAGETYIETLTYDDRARLQSRSITIPGDATYAYDYAYEPNKGTLDTLTYPVSTGGYRLKLQYQYQNEILQRVVDANAPSTVFWVANSTNAWRKVTQETLGNGIVTNKAYDAVTARLGSIQSGLPANPSGVQNQAYLYDLMGNVTQRQNNKLGLTESFYYGGASDNLYRLEHSSLTNGMGTATNLALTYDPSGNILTKNEPGSAPLFSQTITWTSYNYPSGITANGESASFAYGPDRRRWRMVYSSSGSPESTYYIGDHLEKIVASGVVKYRHRIDGGQGPVALLTRSNAGGDTLQYVLADHQRSIESIADSAGGTVANESFSAHGERRNSDTWSGPANNGALLDGITRQGYTYQTALGAMGLNHMNGRVQDAISGRFLSADPYITDSGYSQNYNRYSYVYNNPVTNIDPSGFGTDCLVGSMCGPRLDQLPTIVVHGCGQYCLRIINAFGEGILDRLNFSLGLDAAPQLQTPQVTVNTEGDGDEEDSGDSEESDPCNEDNSRERRMGRERQEPTNSADTVRVLPKGTNNGRDSANTLRIELSRNLNRLSITIANVDDSVSAWIMSHQVNPSTTRLSLSYNIDTPNGNMTNSWNFDKFIEQDSWVELPFPDYIEGPGVATLSIVNTGPYETQVTFRSHNTCTKTQHPR